ncbi:hypothetical protein K439DRAFT_1408598 [Ramaria rubella]|nr:hypothetical protein K439DRAFT_1408598 [Ramaria rubella]
MSPWKKYFKTLAMAAIISPLPIQGNIVGSERSSPVPADGTVVKCSKLSWNPEVQHRAQPHTQSFAMFRNTPPFSSTVHFSIPTSSPLVFLTSKGSYDQDSSITVQLSESDSSSDDIEIDVVVGYYDNAALERADVCLLERDGGGKGVGLFTQRCYWPWCFLSYKDKVRFTVTIRLPSSGSSENPLIINALETTMGIWSHHIASLNNQVVFGSLSLKGHNAPIQLDSVSVVSAYFNTANAPISGSCNASESLVLSTSNAAVLGSYSASQSLGASTSNGAISGSYGSSRSLVLSTSNAPITANIRLWNGNSHSPTSLQLTTSNSRIETPIALISTYESPSTPSAFSVSATTSNGILDVTFPEAPTSPFSHLSFIGKTSNSRSSVKLHPTYEGSISLSTSTFLSPKVLSNSNIEDPSGQGRRRTVHSTTVGNGHLEANVKWGTDEGSGNVVITTSNAGNEVDLG